MMSFVTGRQSYTLPQARQFTTGFSSSGRAGAAAPPLLRLPLRFTRMPSIISSAGCASCGERDIVSRMADTKSHDAAANRVASPDIGRCHCLCCRTLLQPCSGAEDILHSFQ